MGREAMNAAPTSGRRRSSKDPMAKKLDAKEKPSASHPLKDLNRGSFPPPIGASAASKAGCFRFFDSSSKESLARSKPATATPRSAPPNARNVAFDSKSTAKAAGARTSRKDASKSDLEVPRKIGSTKFSERATTDLVRKWSKKKSGSDPFRKIDLEEGTEGPVASCPASSPKRTLLSFGAHEAVDEAKQILTTTPTSSATPPVQASISPEVPMDSSLATPACFAAGHVIVGVHDRRKCRPRGILSVGGRELEIPELNGGVADPARVSVTPPPPAGASVHWLSSPSKNENLGHCTSFSSSSKVRVAHCPAEASIDWLLSPGEDEEVPRGESVIGTRNAPDHGFWKLSPDTSSNGKSPELRGLLGLNSPCLETTPSSGIMLLRTPTTGDSVSPFSSILERIAKTSKSEHSEPRRRSEHRLLSGNSLVEDQVTPAPSLYSSSTKNNNLCTFKVDAVANALKIVSLSPRPQRHNANHQTTFSGLSFQFGSIETSSNSVDLNRFQHPDNICAQERIVPGDQTRISWREGLVSRIFAMSDSEGYRWVSDDEDDLNRLEGDRTRLTSGYMESNGGNAKNPGANVDNQNGHIAAAGFGSIEFVFEAEKAGAKGPTQGPISSAESISMEGIVLASSDDSDWTFSYKNHLYEI